MSLHLHRFEFCRLCYLRFTAPKSCNVPLEFGVFSVFTDEGIREIRYVAISNVTSQIYDFCYWIIFVDYYSQLKRGIMWCIDRPHILLLLWVIVV